MTERMSQIDISVDDDPNIKLFLSASSLQTRGADVSTAFAPHEPFGAFFAGAGAAPDNADSSTVDGITSFYLSNPTTVSSTPDLSSSSSIRWSASAYSTPSSASPHPHPFQVQEDYKKTSVHNYLPDNDLLYAQRPVSVRFPTNPPSPEPHSDVAHTTVALRRRSLSHGDADRVVASTQHIANPVFVRLQELRTQNIAREPNKKRLRKKYLHGTTQKRHADQENNLLLTQPWSHTFMPPNAPIDTTSLRRVLHATDIGTPLGESFNLPDQHAESHLYTPQFSRMSYEEQNTKSLRVIEVGAMAVLDAQKAKESLYQHERSKIDGIMKKLDDVESHLENEPGVHSVSITACRVIREDIRRKEGVNRKGEGSKSRALTQQVRSDGAHGWGDGTVALSDICAQTESH